LLAWEMPHAKDSRARLKGALLMFLIQGHIGLAVCVTLVISNPARSQAPFTESQSSPRQEPVVRTDLYGDPLPKQTHLLVTAGRGPV